MTLKDKTVKGLSWGFIDTIAGSGITAVISIVLARLIPPSEFGLIGMTAIFITLGTSLMDSGFSGALTRKKNAEDKDFNTVFYTNILLSAVLYLILYFTAPFISSFYEIPILTTIIRYLSLSILLNAFAQVQKVILTRKIDFKSQAVVSLLASVSSGVIGITMAVKGFGVWSLVAQQLSKITVSSILLWVFSSWKPSFVFSFSSFKEMFSFGSRLLVSSIINVVWNEVYSLIIGKFYSPTMVGFYSRADKFKNIISSNISIVVQKVSYPVLSTIQDDQERQLRVYKKVLKTTALITSTLILGLFASSKSMILVLIGEQWLPSVIYLKILCLSGIFLPLILISANILNANGRSDLTLKLEIIKTLLAVLPVLLGVLYSIKALLWGIFIISIISFIIHAWFVSRILGYGVMVQIKDIFPYIFSASIMAAIVWALELIDISYWFMLIIQLIVGFIIIVMIYEFIFKSEEYSDIKGEFFNLLKSKKTCQ